MKRQLALTMIVLTMGAYGLVIPGCGDRNNQATANPYYNCQPGQICVTNNNVQGIPLLNSPAVGFLDPARNSNLVLSFGAPNMVAGQAYFGPVNISGVLHLAPGICPGPYYNGGDFQVTGQGDWYSGYGGYVARVGGSLQIVGGTGGGGYVNIAPALIGAFPPGQAFNGYNYFLGYSAGVQVSMCGMTFPLY